MTRTEIIKKAAEMNYDSVKAIECRVRYLDLLIEREENYINNMESVPRENEMTGAFLRATIQGSKIVLDRLQKELNRLINPPTSSKDTITDDDIEAARKYPIDSIMEFNGGRCKAWCHDSDSDSMSWYKKVNKAHCFVCNKSFSALDTLMERDGYSFIEAVKQLR